MGDNGLDLEGLAARVQLLEDQEAVRDLAAAYHAHGCERDSTAMADLFHPDAEIDYGKWGVTQGREAIRELFWKSVSDDQWVPFTVQFLENFRYELTGDTGTGRRYITCCLVRDGESYVCVAKFDDHYAKSDGRWYFQKVKMTVFFWVPLREGWANATAMADSLAAAESHMQA